MGIRDYLSDPTRGGAIRQAIGRAFRRRRRGRDYAPRIVVVIDDATSRDDLVATLGHAAYTVTVASDPQQALELCRAKDVDIVLADADATTREGAALSSLLRSSFPEVKTIAFVPAGSPADAVVADAADTLPTGVDAVRLLDAIERALGAD